MYRCMGHLLFPESNSCTQYTVQPTLYWIDIELRERRGNENKLLFPSSHLILCTNPHILIKKKKQQQQKSVIFGQKFELKYRAVPLILSTLLWLSGGFPPPIHSFSLRTHSFSFCLCFPLFSQRGIVLCTDSPCRLCGSQVIFPLWPVLYQPVCQPLLF